MKYAVHLYPTVRVKVTGIEANTYEEAIAKAEESVDLHEVLDNPRPCAANIECVAWDESANNFVLVDPLDEEGEIIEEESQWFDGNGNPLVDSKTALELKAAAADEANLFMQEILNSVETLTGIANFHGTRTLADLMYLHSAILRRGFIEHIPGESAVLEFASRLPSGERWTKFINETPGTMPICTHDQQNATHRYALADHDADAGLIWSVGGAWSASLLSQSPTLMTGPQADALKKRHPNAHIVDVIVFREAHQAYIAGVNSVIDQNAPGTPETRKAAHEAGIKALVGAGFSEDALDLINGGSIGK